MPDRVQIAGVQFDNVDEAEALGRIRGLMEQNDQFYVVTPNPEFVFEAQNNPEFKDILNKAVLSIPDGTGILWAASFLNYPEGAIGQSRLQGALSLLKILWSPSSVHTVLKSRVAGTDLMEKIIAESQQTVWRIFLLGGHNGVAEKTKNILQEKYPRSSIVGTFEGDASPSGDSETVAAVNAAQPDIIFVACGAPKQELWIERNLKKIPSVRMAMGVGGAFDFISGKKRRAPRCVQKIGMEWFWRLVYEPWRLPRIWRATAGFIRLILREQQKNKKVIEMK